MRQETWSPPAFCHSIRRASLSLTVNAAALRERLLTSEAKVSGLWYQEVGHVCCAVKVQQVG